MLLFLLLLSGDYDNLKRKEERAMWTSDLESDANVGGTLVERSNEKRQIK